MMCINIFMYNNTAKTVNEQLEGFFDSVLIWANNISDF